MDTRRMERLYSVDAAAKKLGGLSKFTIYTWISRGLLERTRVGGRVMVRESSLLKLLQACNQQEGPQSKRGGSNAGE
jgi:excisionase family DNA binding protein